MSTRAGRFLAIFILAAGPALAGFRTAPQAQGRPISGRVIDGTSGDALPNAQVEIASNVRPPPGMARPAWITGPEGAFAIANAPLGPFLVRASLSGYVTGYSGQRSPNGPYPDRQFLPGEPTSNILVRLWRTAAVSGTVRDNFDEPVAGVTVQSFAVEISGGRAILAPSGSARTDDRGMYRIFGLSPGDYRIAVLSADTLGRTSGYPTTFQFDTLLASRSPTIAFVPGGERENVDVHLSRKDLATIVGRVTGNTAASSLMSRVVVRVLPADGISPTDDIEVTKASVNAQGEFTLDRLPAGRYLLRATAFPELSGSGQALAGSNRVVFGAALRPGSELPPLMQAPTFWGQTTLTVDGTPLPTPTLELHEGLRLSGRVVFEPAGNTPDEVGLHRIPIFIHPASPNHDGKWQVSRVERGGHFQSPGLPPGKYSVSFASLGGFGDGWYLKSVSLGGTDITGSHVELGTADVDGIVVTLSKVTTEITGAVIDGMGRMQPDAVVYVFPRERRYWIDNGVLRVRFATVLADRTGRYDVSGLTPGDYVAVALSRTPDTGSWLDPAMLEILQPFGVAVQLVGGQTASRDLKVVDVTRVQK